MDDIFHESDDSDNISSDEEIPSIEDIPDTITYRWPKNIIEITETETLEEGGPKKLQLKLLRASDKVCAFGSMGNTRICCVILTPVNESDQEDFEAGISVKVRGARYISEIALRDCISSIIPSNRLKRIFIDITFHVYSDSGNVLPTALMTSMFCLTASRVDVKGIVTAVNVFIDPNNQIVVCPNKQQEQDARDKKPGYACITAMKVMKDDHLRWWDVEGLPKASQVSKAMKVAAKEATGLYPQMATLIQKLMEDEPSVVAE